MEFSSWKVKVGAVIVIYNPNTEFLDSCIRSIDSQVDELCIVDNTEGESTSLSITQYSNIKYFQLRHNIGIAAAQNVGIKYFESINYDFVLFSDQDSVSTSTLVRNLLDAYFCISKKYVIAAIGPMPINRKTGTQYIYSQYIVKKEKEATFNYYIMQSIISSYSLIPIKNFDSVGLMNENLFIDFVDDEWCWRANYCKGMKCILLPNISISHELGMSKSFCGLQISVSSTFRIYYQIRNLIWLCRKKYVPSNWKKKNIIKLIPKMIYYSLIPSNRITYIKRMSLGMRDGLTLSLK